MIISFEFTSVMNVRNQTSQVFCHKLWSIWWLLVQVCLLITECLIFHYVQKQVISRQFESIQYTNLQHISILLLWIDGRQDMQLRLCTVAGLLCSSVRNISPLISLHDFSYRRIMKTCLCQILRMRILFCSSSRDSRFKHISVILHNIFARFVFSWSASQIKWSKNDVDSSKSSFFMSTFHIGPMFCFFPVSSISSTYTNKNSPFSRITKKHSNLECLSQSCSSSAFSHCFFPW